MKRLLVCFPEKSILVAFDRLAAPIFDKFFSNTLESRTLATLRDTLLPKLLSGELRVEAAESELSEATWKDSLHVPRDGSREVGA